jgi:hypothetical protein
MRRNYLSILTAWVTWVFVLVLAGAAFLPAAGLVSAAGGKAFQALPPEIALADEGDNPSQDPLAEQVVVQPDDDFHVYLPWIVRRWPPIPYPPLLESAGDLVLYTPYTLTWSVPASESPVFSYTLQESLSPDFSNPLDYTASVTTYSAARQAAGTYYYRVQGYNTWGPGEWSNVEAVPLYTLLDSFDDPATGWSPRRTSAPDIDLMVASYIAGELQTMVGDKFDFAIFSPMQSAPATPYSLKMRTKIIHKVNEVSYGIAFGGNAGTFCTVERANATDPSGCFSHYYRLNVVWAGNYLKYNVKRVDYHDASGAGRGEELLGFGNLTGYGYDPADWHNWEIQVYNNGFGIYMNDHFLAWISDTTYLNDRYYGIFSSTYEYNYAHFQHAYFDVVPLEPTTILSTLK